MTRGAVALGMALGALAVSGTAGAEAARVTVDGQHRLRIGGDPFFPIGLYNVRPESALAEARAMGFNTVHAYLGEGVAGRDGSAASPEAVRAYLDAAREQGLMVMMGLPRYDIVRGAIGRLEDRILALRDHPALLAWYLYDEPYHSGIPAEPIQTAADRLRRLDPTRPTTLVLCLLHERVLRHAADPDYIAIPDILMTDRYPVVRPGSRLGPVAREIAVARLLVRDRKPVWSVVQLHGRGPGGTGHGLLEPDGHEVRNMTYQSIASGASGVFFYTYYGGEQFQLERSPAARENAARMAAELRALVPLLLSDSPPQPPFRVLERRDLIHRAFALGDTAYLLAVNLSREPVEIEAAAASGRLPDRVRVWFEDRDAQVEDGRIRETIEPIGIRLYEAKGVLAADPPPGGPDG